MTVQLPGAPLGAAPEQLPPTKTCTRCGAEGPTSKAWGGLLASRKPECVKCAQNGHARWRRTGFDPDLYDTVKLMQGYACAICGMDLRGLTGPRVNADHCHATGAPRGVLCHMCNRGLGMFGDDPARLQAAAEYLRRYQGGAQ